MHRRWHEPYLEHGPTATCTCLGCKPAVTTRSLATYATRPKLSLPSTRKQVQDPVLLHCNSSSLRAVNDG